MIRAVAEWPPAQDDGQSYFIKHAGALATATRGLGIITRIGHMMVDGRGEEYEAIWDSWNQVQATLEAQLQNLQDETQFPGDWEDAKAPCKSTKGCGSHLANRVGKLHSVVMEEPKGKDMLGPGGYPTTIPVTLWVFLVTKNWCEDCTERITALLEEVHKQLTPVGVQTALKALRETKEPITPREKWEKIKGSINGIRRAYTWTVTLAYRIEVVRRDTSLGAMIVALGSAESAYKKLAKDIGEEEELKKILDLKEGEIWGPRKRLGKEEVYSTRLAIIGREMMMEEEERKKGKKEDTR